MLQLEPMGVEGSGKTPDHQQWHTLEETMGKVLSYLILSYILTGQSRCQGSVIDKSHYETVAHGQPLSKTVVVRK